ncbi:signal recognition particle protein [Candidatus Woesearchaeota archaeon]|nr:signal recognition particle protein [Candidatus Woesearchaeota archaeon]
MVLDKLGDSLKATLRKITGSLFVDEALIDELIRDLQRALLQSDVNVQLVFDLSKEIKKRALAEKEIKGVNQKEHLIKIVYEELVKFLGKEKHGIKILDKKPFKIMMVGTYGSGKSTSIGKIAKYYSKRGYKIATLALDVHRPAAIDQLEQLSEQVKVKCFSDKKEKDPIKIYKKFKDEYHNYDLLIIDTAGRHDLDNELIKELKSLNNEIKPDENLLVISADIGQAASKLAKGFLDACGITGVVITKLDGTAKAGGALTATAVTNAPVKFIGVGEKIDDLEEFDPEGFVSRLLGMGDIKVLLEKAEEAISKEKAEDLGKRFLKGEFNLIDLYEQMEAMSKMGPLSKIMELIPGMGNMNIPKEMLQVQESKLKKWKYIMQSMRKEELEDPEIITRSRIDRIARGSGATASEVRELLKQYKQSKKVAKVLKGVEKEQDISKLMKKFGKKMPKGFGM